MPFADDRPGRPGAALPGGDRKISPPQWPTAWGRHAGLVALPRFSSPPSLENREPPRLSPGIRADAFFIRRPTEPHSGQEGHPSRIGPLGDTVIHRPADILSGRHGAADSLGRQAGD